MRAALYARVSTDKQKDENTIDTQLNEVKEAIKQDGNILLEENVYFDEGWSGAYIDRPSLDLLRQDARKHKFDIVYVYDKGRLSRRYMHQEIIIDELRKLKIEFKSLHDINGKSAEEQVMGGVMGIFHEYERTKTSERFRLSKMNKVRGGSLLGYNAPYGYNYIPVQGKGLSKVNGSFVINENEADVIKKVFVWVGIEGISLREVIRRLYAEGIQPKKQRRSMWTKGPVVRMLQNETYIGNHHYNKTESVLPKNPIKARTHFRHTDKTSRKQRDRSEWLLVKVPMIIDKALFDRAQKQIALNAKYASRNAKHEYLFSGLTYCTCGSKRTSEGARGHYYYRCTDRLHRFPEPPQCNQGGVNVTVMDKLAWDKLAILLTEPKLLNEQFERFKSSQVRNIDIIDSDFLKKDLKNLLDEENRYIKAYGRGFISEKAFDENVTDVKRRRISLASKETPATIVRPNKGQDFNFEEMSKAFGSLLKELRFEEKQKIVRQIVDKVIATKEEVIICGYIPLTHQTTEKAVLHAEYRHRRPTQRRQINPVQRPD